MEVPLRATKLGNAEVDGHRGPGEQIWKQKMDHMSVLNNHWAGDYFKHGHTKNTRLRICSVCRHKISA